MVKQEEKTTLPASLRRFKDSQEAAKRKKSCQCTAVQERQKEKIKEIQT